MNERLDASSKWIDPKVNRPITVHGFRSTFRDWCAEVSAYPREVAEHALAHKLPDRTEAAPINGERCSNAVRR